MSYMMNLAFDRSYDVTAYMMIMKDVRASLDDHYTYTPYFMTEPHRLKTQIAFQTN